MLRRIPFSTLMLFSFLLGTAGNLFAEDPAVFFTFLADRGRYDFEGGFYVKADPQVVWNVLTDFDHYSKYISNMHCRIRQKDPDGFLVDQTVGGGFLFIQENIHTRLYVQEDPISSVNFTGVDHQAFSSYQGEWKVLAQPPGGQVKVTYDLQVDRSLKTPGFLTQDLFSGSQGDLLGEMRKEILKRQARMEKDQMRDVKEAKK